MASPQRRLIPFRPPEALATRLDRYARIERPQSINKAVIALVDDALSRWEGRSEIDEIPQDQLDIATVVVRLEQIKHEGYEENGHWLLERVIECDLPRLRRLLGPAALKQVREASESP